MAEWKRQKSDTIIMEFGQVWAIQANLFGHTILWIWDLFQRTLGLPSSQTFHVGDWNQPLYFHLIFLYLEILFCFGLVFGFVLFLFLFSKNSILKIRKTLQLDAHLIVAYVYLNVAKWAKNPQAVQKCFWK